MGCRHFASETPKGIFVRINTIHETPGKVGDVLLSDFPNCLGELEANAKPRDCKTTEE